LGGWVKRIEKRIRELETLRKRRGREGGVVNAGREQQATKKKKKKKEQREYTE